MSISILNTDAGLSGTTLLNAESAQTVTGAKTFDRDPNPPFVVTSGSAVVPNLDADKWDGQDLPADPNADRMLFWDDSAGALAYLTPGTGLTVTDTTIAVSSTVVTAPARDVVQAEVVSSVAETAVFSETITGGSLGTTRALRVTVLGDYLNNSGSSRNLTLRVKYGATTIGTITYAVATAATRHAVHLFTVLTAANSASAQYAHTRSVITANGALDGVTSLAGSDGAYSAHASVAEASASDKTLAVTVEHSASASTISFRANSVLVELL